MPRVQAELGGTRAGVFVEVADQLVPEEVDRDAVGVAPGQLATQAADVERLRLVEIVDRDGQMEDVAALPHDTALFEALEGVGPEAEPDRLEPEERGRRDVAQIHVGTDPPHEVALQLRRRRLEEQLRGRDVAVQDLLDEPEAELAVGPADPRAAALPGLQRHEDGAGLEILVDALDPAVRAPGARSAPSP